MVKFVNGAMSYGAITEIINGAHDELYIVAPYLKIPQQTKNYIKNVDTRGIKFIVISRAENNTQRNVDENDIQFLRGLISADVRVCENLHAKCFINENEGLITSMNLHEHSQAYNWEMGIRFTKNEDLAIYDATFDEVQMIVKQSKENPKIKFVNPAARSQKFTPGPVPPKNNSNSELKPNNNYASTSETLTFGNKELGINYAGFWLRLAAAVIDGLILLIPFVICVVISGTNPLIFYFLIWIVGFAYFAYLESSPKMATFGKEAMGLIVTNMDGSQLTFKQASIRYIGKLLSLVILYGGFIMIGFTEKKQGLHDMIAKTLVVKK
ncbi:RDD family protein [Methanoregula sp.]|uniref:RDD family protein n=1 Tax=Methanoregula sp. TaxID=2052170 RepID=UPI00236C462C|nr:RDD family protein [Methanoregula sp.]MDD1685575.1 RDD family protein [Methanoregula sp.]